MINIEMCIRSECSTHNTNEFSACVVVGIMGLVNNYEVMINYVTLLLLVNIVILRIRNNSEEAFPD